jgi:hypothetical protein
MIKSISIIFLWKVSQFLFIKIIKKYEAATPPAIRFEPCIRGSQLEERRKKVVERRHYFVFFLIPFQSRI